MWVVVWDLDRRYVLLGKRKEGECGIDVVCAHSGV